MRGHRVFGPVYRVGVAVLGFGVIALGLVLVPFPGPGWLVVFIGLGILATEFAWARRLLEFARSTLRRWTDWLAHAPLLVRMVLLLATVLVVAAVVMAYLAWVGVPAWVPFVD